MPKIGDRIKLDERPADSYELARMLQRYDRRKPVVVPGSETRTVPPAPKRRGK